MMTSYVFITANVNENYDFYIPFFYHSKLMWQTMTDKLEKNFFFFLIIFIFIFHKKFMILIYKRNNTMCIKYMWLRKMTRDSSLFHQVPPATSSVFWGLFLMLSLSSKEINKKPACVQITCAHPRILAKANLATRPLLCTKLFFPNTALATCPNG